MATGSDECEEIGEGYRTVFERAPHAILVHDIETKTIIEVNDAACELLGTEREALLGVEVGEFSPEGDEFTSEQAEALMEGAVENGQLSAEWQIIRPDGESRWVQVQLRRLRFDGTVRIVAYLVDITEQKRRKRRLEENDATLHQLTDTTNDVFWLFDSDFSELQFINQAYEKVWGRCIEDLREDPMDFMEGVHPDDRETVMEVIGQLQDGNSTSTEYRVNAEEDFERWVSVRGEPVFDDDSDAIRAAGYARDITERKERERQVRALAEATQDLSFARTPDTVAEHVVNITDQVLDQHVTIIWRYNEDEDKLEPWKATDSARRLAEESASGGLNPVESDTFEMKVFQNGEPVTVDDYQSLDNPSHPDVPLGSLLMVPISDQVILHVGSTEVNDFDQTEENLLAILASNAKSAFKRADREQSLETYKDKLERSNENLQRFAYIASHDLQEPLRSVTSYLDLLEIEYADELDEDAQFYIERATNNANQMSTLIDALLKYSRVKTDEGKFVELESRDVLEDTLQRLERMIEENQAEITVQSLPTIVADRNQLGQVFQNLLTNAIEHSDAPPEIEICAEETDDVWEFAVADNGPGIPERQQDRIFDIFQQANTDGNGEAGIGLAICERIVSHHDGEICVESDGTGSTFKFTLPKRPVELP